MFARKVQSDARPVRSGPARSLRCPHGVDHPRWCRVCAWQWEARVRHPSWPQPDDRRPGHSA